MIKTTLVMSLVLCACGCWIKDVAESISFQIDSVTNGLINKEILNVGDDMVDFKLYDYNDSVHYLSEFKGQYMVFEFSSLSCGPCLLAKPILEFLFHKYKDRLKLITISGDPVYLWKEKPMGEVSWYEWNDHDYALKIRRKYGIKAIPAFVVINPSGIIVAVCPDTKSLFETIEKYLQNENKDNIIINY